MVTILKNKKAYFDYEILDKFEAGISLLGFEVKSIKSGKGSLAGSYITIKNSEVYLVNTEITPYQPKNTPKEYNSKRPRKLLLTKKEIQKLAGFEKQKGLTIVPLSVYNKGRNLKLELAVVRGKKKSDKREIIKKRDSDREIRRTLKREY